MLNYGGPGIFLPSVREAAAVMVDFFDELDEYVEKM
jgi:hypothetical protein